jgi:hypothetical protein
VLVVNFYFRSLFFPRFDFVLVDEYFNVFCGVVSDDPCVAQAIDVILDAEVVLVEEPDAIASDCDTAACISSLSFFRPQWCIENSRFRLGIGGPWTTSFTGVECATFGLSLFIR